MRSAVSWTRLGLSVFAALVLLALVLSLPTWNGHAARTSDTLTVAITGGISQLDPGLATYNANSYLVANQLYDTLTIFPPGQTFPVPSLAQSWTASEDATVFTFTLRTDVQFHDGSSLDASAVLENFERWWDPAHPAHQEFEYFANLIGYQGPGSLITGLDAPSPDKFVIHLSRSYSPLPFVLANSAFSILSPASFGSDPVGSGPFKFSENSASLLTLEANTAYWGHPPYLATLKFQNYATPEDQFAAVQSGAAQVAYNVPANLYPIAAADPNLRLTRPPSGMVGYLGMNRASGPLSKLAVRQAIAHAVDKAQILADFYDPLDTQATQFLPLTQWGADPTITDYAYDPALAASLLEGAGYSQGVTLTLTYRDVLRAYLPQPDAIASAIAADLEAAGFHVVVQEQPSQEYLEAVYSGNAELFLLGWGIDYYHPDNYFSPHFCNPTNLGFGPLDFTLCNSLEGALANPDLAAQESIYRAASRTVHGTLPLIPLVHDQHMLLVQANVAGLEVAALEGEAYENVFYAAGPNAPVDPDEGGQLSAGSTEAPSATVDLPSGAVTEPVILAYVPVTGTVPPPRLLPVAGAFDLLAYSQSQPLAGLVFGVPVTVSVFYQATPSNLNENSLELFIWEDGAWTLAAQTCEVSQPVQRDIAKNILRTPVCRTGRFGVFGSTDFPLFLPLTQK